MVMFVPVDQQGFYCFRTEQAHSKALLYGFSVCSFQYGNVGAMAITLCQSLGQNIGMRWNNVRNSAGKSQHESRTVQGRKDREIYRPRVELNKLSKQESKMNVEMTEADDNSEGWD